ncbi:Hypothetical protein PBC10988_23780 [Planctomycetales bacterium 10988]|nr:Hypothetical protein PBC10988_23780 [Planctomycetales bacterium 10988]
MNAHRARQRRWRRRQPLRKGMAPLEMVMSLPIMVGLFVLLLVVCDAAKQKALVITESRQAAWVQRDAKQADQVFFFGFRNGGDDMVAGAESREVMSPQFLGNFADARSSHEVMGGAWDFDELPLDSPVHFEEMGLVAVGGNVNQAGAIVGSLESLFTSLDVGQLASMAANALGIGNQFDQLLDGIDNANLQKAKDAIQKELDKAKNLVNKLKEQIQEVKGKIEEAKQKITEAKETFDNALEQAQDALDEILDDPDATPEQIDEAKEKFNEIKEELTDTLEETQDQLEGAIEAFEEQIEGLEKALESAEDAVDAIPTSIEDIADIF